MQNVDSNTYPFNPFPQKGMCIIVRPSANDVKDSYSIS